MGNLGIKTGDILIVKNSSVPEKERTELWKVKIDLDNKLIILEKYKKGKIGVDSVEKISFDHWITLKNMKIPRYRGENKKNGKFDNGLRFRPTGSAPFEIEGGDNE